jgi:hypothetical protein
MLLGLRLVLGGSRFLVDWRAARAGGDRGDDWGLCGYVPPPPPWRVSTWPAQCREIPPVYLNSTLEDSAAVAALAAVLAAGRGRDGGPAVLQPNYIMGWQASPAAAGPADRPVFRSGTLPDLPATYARPGLWRAVADAVAAGVWYPEYHGLWHYVPEDRLAACDHDSNAATAARRGILLFPGELPLVRTERQAPAPTLAAELATGLSAFAGLFGRRPDAVIAPDYHWSRHHERLWRDAGLSVVQSQREQRHPDYEGRPGGCARLWPAPAALERAAAHVPGSQRPAGQPDRRSRRGDRPGDACAPRLATGRTRHRRIAPRQLRAPRPGGRVRRSRRWGCWRPSDGEPLYHDRRRGGAPVAQEHRGAGRPTACGSATSRTRAVPVLPGPPDLPRRRRVAPGRRRLGRRRRGGD